MKGNDDLMKDCILLAMEDVREKMKKQIDATQTGKYAVIMGILVDMYKKI